MQNAYSLSCMQLAKTQAAQVLTSVAICCSEIIDVSFYTYRLVIIALTTQVVQLC